MAFGILSILLYFFYFTVLKQVFKECIKTLLLGVLTINFMYLGVVFQRNNIDLIDISFSIITLICFIKIHIIKKINKNSINVFS